MWKDSGVGRKTVSKTREVRIHMKELFMILRREGDFKESYENELRTMS
jgi:hypothetical protein